MKWGAVKQARQQIARMEKKGISTDAAAHFKSQQKIIRESGMSREKKSAAMERAAKQFMRSGMGTVKGIEEKFAHNKAAKSKYVKEMVGDDPAKKAEFLDASANQRKIIAARHYIGSEAIQQVAEMTTDKRGNDDPKAFYEILGRTSVYIATYGELPPDQLSDLIIDYTENYYND